MKNREACAVTVQAGQVSLDGDLCIPPRARAVVVFAHGSGSSRLSPRNTFVAQVLRDAGLGTLLFDLLTPEEEVDDLRTARLRFDIQFLGERLLKVTHWLQERQPDLKPGYFGASTGAGAALYAAARFPQVYAVVSRGGRPDLADSDLERVASPTLLIVGGDDRLVLELNSQALSRLAGEKSMKIIPGATHLFEEPGALERVAELAADWFTSHLGS